MLPKLGLVGQCPTKTEDRVEAHVALVSCSRKMLSSRSLITLKSRWSPQLIYVHFYPQTGLVLIVGTFVKLRTIQYLRHTRRSTSTTIQVDDLVLYEQLVNSINGPIIFIQLVHILFPSYTRELLGNIVFSSIWSALMAIGIFHRAIVGFGIAAVRQVHSLYVSRCTKGAHEIWMYWPNRPGMSINLAHQTLKSNQGIKSY